MPMASQIKVGIHTSSSSWGSQLCDWTWGHRHPNLNSKPDGTNTQTSTINMKAHASSPYSVSMMPWGNPNRMALTPSFQFKLWRLHPLHPIRHCKFSSRAHTLAFLVLAIPTYFGLNSFLIYLLVYVESVYLHILTTHAPMSFLYADLWSDHTVMIDDYDLL